MQTVSRSLSCALLLSLALLTGCEMFSSDAWQRPSPLSGRPEPPPPEEKHETQGSFAVLVGAPGQPEEARVVADIGNFAQSRGFVRESADPSPATPPRYVLGDIRLDVIYRSTDLHVIASLHSFSSKLNRRFIHQFYQDFHQAYASRYGPEASMFENDEADGPDGPARNAGSSGGRGGGGRR